MTAPDAPDVRGVLSNAATAIAQSMLPNTGDGGSPLSALWLLRAKSADILMAIDNPLDDLALYAHRLSRAQTPMIVSPPQTHPDGGIVGYAAGVMAHQPETRAVLAVAVAFDGQAIIASARYAPDAHVGCAWFDPDDTAGLSDDVVAVCNRMRLLVRAHRCQLN